MDHRRIIVCIGGRGNKRSLIKHVNDSRFYEEEKDPFEGLSEDVFKAAKLLIGECFFTVEDAINVAKIMNSLKETANSIVSSLKIDNDNKEIFKLRRKYNQPGKMHHQFKKKIEIKTRNRLRG